MGRSNFKSLKSKAHTKEKVRQATSCTGFGNYCFKPCQHPTEGRHKGTKGLNSSRGNFGVKRR